MNLCVELPHLFVCSVLITMTNACVDCSKKDAEIEYLKAIIALDAVRGEDGGMISKDVRRNVEAVALRQRLELIKNQLLLIRADVQYMNREVHSVFQWISKVISVFLSCCGRVSEMTAGMVIDSATKLGDNVSRLVKTK
jgi:hypothetical protein